MRQYVDPDLPWEYTEDMHRYSILFEEITDPGFPEGWYYAIVPTLSLTTHGKGLEGARAAVLDLLQLWFAEKQANGEEIPREPAVFFTQVEIPDALQVL
jgi:predicted RNase H-like HicB family nuclease